LVKRNVTIDPIHGRINIPNWLAKIEKEPAVRRMMFIRQLGLKAYVDFPGAIHTRYSHSLGAMYLAGRLCDRMAEKSTDQGKQGVAQNLTDNKNELMAAGFLHDIGHGPFSHAVDFALQRLTKQNHERRATVIIDKKLDELEKHGISKSSVSNLVNAEHDHRFLSQIINSQIDVDKLDYLLRDAYHIGYHYGFDLEHFASSYCVLGDDNNLGKCELGLDSTPEAITTAELFILIWKSMYDIIYYIEQSRIAEKMLEKAILDAAANDRTFTGYFDDLDEFLNLHDDGLLSILEGATGSVAPVFAENIREKNLYVRKFESALDARSIQMNEKFLARLASEDGAALGEEITQKLCKSLGLENYDLICDIVKSRVPKKVDLNELDSNGDPIDLKSKSDIIPHIKEKNYIKVYVSPTRQKTVMEDQLKTKLNEIIGAW
jgi:HD superfamily phosphohydrolase